MPGRAVNMIEKAFEFVLRPAAEILKGLILKMKPLKLSPAIKDYIWGGTRLSREFDYFAMTDRQAEAWVLSCHPDGECIVENTAFKGRTLSDVLSAEGRDYTGTDGKKFSSFPVLIKLIDAKDNLSLQVHPDNAYAREHENQDGKTEMWYILDCEEGAQLIFGLKEDMTKEQFEAAVQNGTVLNFCNKVPVKKGDVFFIEAGTLHAIGKGILLAEVQQSSNVTYRVYDYERLQNGKPRELHLKKALDVLKLKKEQRTDFEPKETQAFASSKRTLLASCENFTSYRLDVKDSFEITADESSFVSLVALEGNGVLCHNDSVLTFYKGESVFLPAGLGKIELLGDLTVLETRV